MLHGDPLLRAAQRAATLLMLLALLSAASCMTWRPALTGNGDPVVSTIDPMIDPADPRQQCEEFGCEP